LKKSIYIKGVKNMTKDETTYRFYLNGSGQFLTVYKRDLVCWYGVDENSSVLTLTNGKEYGVQGDWKEVNAFIMQ
jgi:hypothetical protein